MTQIRAVEVVVPARDEAELIGRCLDSIIVACDRLGEYTLDRIRVGVTVVADGCSDRTAALARRFDRVHVLETAALGVGAARRAGVVSALVRHPDRPLESIWLAHTDADSFVAPEWLVAQVELANAGADLRVGEVHPDFSDLTPEQICAWKNTHPVGCVTGHIHGANLGVRASTYQFTGGFRPLDEHEDVDLVERAKLAGARIVSADLPDVVTSGRLVGRTPGGYARYLRDDLLVADLQS